MSDILSELGETVSGGVDAVGKAVSKGVEAVEDVVSVAGDIASNAIDATGAAVVDGFDAVCDTVRDIPDDIEDVPGYLAGVWSGFWDFEVESIDGIGAVLLDEAAYLADAEELPDWIRDVCNGFIGADETPTVGGVAGAVVGGIGKSVSNFGEGVAQLLGHPVKVCRE